jgi:DNA-directed RNA polymerase subunit H (RpoH/RPB5)
MIKECKYKEILDKLNINDQQIDEFTEFDDIIEILDDVQQSNKMPALSVEFILDMYKLDRSKLPNLSKYKIFDIVNRAENTDQIVQIIRQYASYCCKLV